MGKPQPTQLPSYQNYQNAPKHNNSTEIGKWRNAHRLVAEKI